MKRTESQEDIHQVTLDWINKELDQVTSWAGYLHDGYYSQTIERLATYLEPAYPEYKLICVWEDEDWTGTCGDSRLFFKREGRLYMLPRPLLGWLFAGQPGEPLPPLPSELEDIDCPPIRPSQEEPKHNFVLLPPNLLTHDGVTVYHVPYKGCLSQYWYTLSPHCGNTCACQGDECQMVFDVRDLPTFDPKGCIKCGGIRLCSLEPIKKTIIAAIGAGHLTPAGTQFPRREETFIERVRRLSHECFCC